MMRKDSGPRSIPNFSLNAKVSGTEVLTIFCSVGGGDSVPVRVNKKWKFYQLKAALSKRFNIPPPQQMITEDHSNSQAFLSSHTIGDHLKNYSVLLINPQLLGGCQFCKEMCLEGWCECCCEICLACCADKDGADAVDEDDVGDGSDSD
eukprot:TRINITY_DN10712_c0_g2_i1.p1 TRINITY_DN10712_c0_g2~~TRINITY_DN10712_c0_g2_i1.p1  ORF type:complete len:149 (-),score=22.93 TRINITY_DN10712_c0_g2_i1:79-525(-)